MNDSIREHYLEAGNIAARVLKQAVSNVREETSLLHVAEYVENKIQDLGGNIAFPCNISLNEIASHYTPLDDEERFKRGDVVKLDIGVHIEGFIADTAATVEVGTDNHRRLIAASEEALENAIAYIRDKTHTRAIGRIIEETIGRYGFRPVKDLTGHNLDRYNLHAGITIPNYRSFFSQTIKKDMVLAVEPFVTPGRGTISYGKPHIFAVKTRYHGKNTEEIRNRFGTLPFAKRWVPHMDPEHLKGLKKYFELIEGSGEVVAQSEHTVIVGESGCEVITK